jgi:hypothetical protein
MKDKYYIIDKNNRECGPFNEDELNYLGLHFDSLIYCSDWECRRPLNEISELAEINSRNESIFSINPQYGNQIIPKNTIKVEKIDEEVNVDKYSYKNKKVRLFLASWLFFHLVAFILANFGIQNSAKYNSYNNFWPFVNFITTKESFNLYPEPHLSNHQTFEGIFYQYDISEFSIYILSASFIWFVLYTINQRK